MRAIQIQKFGGFDVLEYVENAPIPNIQKNQVLIKVHAAGVNPLDWRIRNGELKLLGLTRLSLICSLNNRFHGC